MKPVLLSLGVMSLQALTAITFAASPAPEPDGPVQVSLSTTAAPAPLSTPTKASTTAPCPCPPGSVATAAPATLLPATFDFSATKPAPLAVGALSMTSTATPSAPRSPRPSSPTSDPSPSGFLTSREAKSIASSTRTDAGPGKPKPFSDPFDVNVDYILRRDSVFDLLTPKSATALPSAADRGLLPLPYSYGTP